MLRIFIKPQSHNDISTFNPNSPALQRGEHGVYVWKDTTLRELIILLRSVAAQYQRPGNAKFSIRHIYTSSSASSSRSEYSGPSYDYKDLGLVFARDLAGEDALEEKGASGRGGGRNDPSIRTLEQHRIIPGDFLDVAFITSIPGGSSSSNRDGGPTSSTSSSTLPGGGGRSLGAPGGVSINGLAGRLATNSSSSHNNGTSEADKAWGIAGDQTIRRRGGGGPGGPMRQGGPSGSNRLNPLLSHTNGRSAPSNERTTEGRGISIMGAGRRASATDGPEDRGKDREDREAGNRRRRSPSPRRRDDDMQG